MATPDWYYDELRQIGVDFADAAAVAAYDRNQGRDPAEDRALIAGLGIGPSDLVIDVGCGTGQFACEAARVAGEVIALDVSPAMLDFARAPRGRWRSRQSRLPARRVSQLCP